MKVHGHEQYSRGFVCKACSCKYTMPMWSPIVECCLTSPSFLIQDSAKSVSVICGTYPEFCATITIPQNHNSSARAYRGYVRSDKYLGRNRFYFQEIMKIFTGVGIKAQERIQYIFVSEGARNGIYLFTLADPHSISPDFTEKTYLMPIHAFLYKKVVYKKVVLEQLKPQESFSASSKKLGKF